MSPGTPQTADAFWIDAPRQGVIRTVALPAPEAASVTVETWFSGISRGTETLVFRGAVPPSQYQAMRAPFQEGSFPFPVKYGYAAVGRAETGPPELRNRPVFVLYPHQTRFSVPVEAALPLPDGLPARRAVLAANMETAVNALWDARPGIGERIAVVGGGMVGCLIAWLASRIAGPSVELIDIDPARQAVADALGLAFRLPEEATANADLVVHASASADGLATSLGLAGIEATVLEVSWYGDRAVAVPLGEGFHARRLVLKSSQVGSVAPVNRPRWSHRRRLALALTLLADDRLDVLLTGESPFHDLPSTMNRLLDRPAGTLCHVIRHPAAPPD